MTARTNNFTRPKILIAEDNLLNQKLVSFMLKNRGYDSKACSNGKEAVKLLEKGDFNLVLMDIEMPEMNGYEATRYIRETLHSDVPVIALTAHASEEEKQKCRMVGMNNYITKPFKAAEFYALIENYLSAQLLEETENK